jgi:hypothetical protein
MDASEVRMRLALHSDRPAIEPICALTWDWGDRVPDALDDRLAGESTHVIVGEVRGKVVAVCGIVVHPAGQVWLEGMRVDPGREPWVGFVDGHESLDDSGRTAAVAALAQRSRVHAAHLGVRQVSVMVPDVPWLRSALGAAGFGFGDWQGALWAFERWVASDLGDTSGF